MRILYNSKDLKFKKPFGCVRENENIEINIHIPKSVETIKVSIVFKNDNDVCKQVELVKQDEYEMYEIYNASFSMNKADLYFYYFKIDAKYSSFSFCSAQPIWVG